MFLFFSVNYTNNIKQILLSCWYRSVKLKLYLCANKTISADSLMSCRTVQEQSTKPWQVKYNDQSNSFSTSTYLRHRLYFDIRTTFFSITVITFNLFKTVFSHLYFEHMVAKTKTLIAKKRDKPYFLYGFSALFLARVTQRLDDG